LFEGKVGSGVLERKRIEKESKKDKKEIRNKNKIKRRIEKWRD
jgi:hypothetical protein